MITAFKDQKTFIPKAGTIARKWFVIDAKDQVLGRISSQLAKILTGKNKTIYTPAVDCGDFVIAVNADKIKLTGDKVNQKVYFYHTAHPGGARITSYKKLSKENPRKMLQIAVKRMLPRTRLSSRQILRLKIYTGDTHPHGVQQPQKVEAVG